MTTISLLNEAFDRLERIEDLCKQMRSLLETITEIKAADADNKWYDTESLRDAALMIRTRNALLRNRIKTVGEVRKMSTRELLKIRGIGPNGLKDIEKMLKVYEIKTANLEKKHFPREEEK